MKNKKKYQKVFLSLILIGTLNTNIYAFDSAATIPILTSISEAMKSVDGVLNISLGVDGFGADGRVLTDKVSNALTDYVPEPFRDNAKNAVDACLKDLRGKLFKDIKWPSVEVCGHDIMSDLKADVANYLKQLGTKYEWSLLGGGKGNGGLPISGTKGENKEWLKKHNKEVLKETISKNENPSANGIKAGMDNANNNSDKSYEYNKNEVNYDTVNYTQTLEDIKNISKNINTLGVNFNPAIVTSAGKQMNENTFIDVAITRNMRTNQQLINTYENVLKYREVANEGGTQEEVDNNKINNPAYLKNILVLVPKNITVPVTGASDEAKASGKTQMDHISHSVQSILNFYTDSYENGSSSPMLKADFLKEYFKNTGQDFISNDVDTYNYLVQATKIYHDAMFTQNELKADNSEEGKTQKLLVALESILKMQFVQVSQDYQYGKVMLNTTNASNNLQIALLKNIADKLRLLNYTNANLNTIIK